MTHAFTDFLLQENGSFLLLEDGCQIILEQSLKAAHPIKKSAAWFAIPRMRQQLIPKKKVFVSEFISELRNPS